MRIRIRIKILQTYQDQEQYDDDDDLKENIVWGRDVKLCSVASPVTLHVVDFHTVAIGALRDMMELIMMIMLPMIMIMIM